jgi:TonB-dependent starch-binding outer membrane protein SusC
MALVRSVLPTLAAVVLAASSLGAQASGSIRGRVVDTASNLPLASVVISLEGVNRATASRSDGTYELNGVPTGIQRVRARRIGYAGQTLQVSVRTDAVVTADFSLVASALALTEVVVTGYGTTKREAITGSVATVDAVDANKGVITNATQLLQGRVAGLEIIQNSGEPGAGSQVRIRGGTSINASNDPLYVVDGVPLANDGAAPGGSMPSFNAALGRDPLNSINPDDIESVTILKDASATAIYGSRGANGVILVQTKRGANRGGVSDMVYETYMGVASPTKSLGLLTGSEYRAFVTANVAALGAPAVASLGTADTDWEKELTRTAYTTNHNLAFSGGSEQTHYRASLNYFNQNGVVLANGLSRYQGRLNADHFALNHKLQLSLNLMTSRVNDAFSPNENTGGFLGGLFTNMAIYNPTFPVYRADGSFFETGCPVTATTCVPSAQDVKNPVAMALQLQDNAESNRLLGNVSATLTLLDNLSAQTSFGVDNTNSVRRSYAPRASALGASYGGFADQGERNLENLNFQQLLTYSPTHGASELEVVGGYENTKNDARGFNVAMQGFLTDVFGVNNLGAGAQLNSTPYSYLVQSSLVSFFTRANYGYNHKYFLTGVLRKDGSSRLAPGHQWAVFPALAASWRLTEENFMRNSPMGLSTLALRASWGKQGNQAVQPYQTQLLLRADPGASYPFGGATVSGLRAAQVGNPDLKWETSTQTSGGLDFGFMRDRVTGGVEVYQKDTKDLLLVVPVPQPAVVSTQLENIGSLRNRGIEANVDMELYKAPKRSLTGGLVFTKESNQITSLGDTARYIATGGVSGQGQSGQNSQRIKLGDPIGTFFGFQFLRVNAAGQQVFACKTASTKCVSNESTDPIEEDKGVIGNANPSFTVGLRNNATWNNFDASWLWRGEFGGDVFNNTALVYGTKSDATQGRNFLRSALTTQDAITEPAKFSSRWIESRTFVRLQNLTVGYQVPVRYTASRPTRLYVSGNNLALLTKYTGYDPEVFVASGVASRGIDYLVYPPARTFTLGARVQF